MTEMNIHVFHSDCTNTEGEESARMFVLKSLTKAYPIRVVAFFKNANCVAILRSNFIRYTTWSYHLPEKELF